MNRTLNTQISTSGIPEGLLWNDRSAMLNDHLYFCLSKSCRSLKAIRILYDEKLFEDSLTLLRSVYEAYLSMRYVSETNDQNVFDYLIMNPISLKVGALEPLESNGKIIKGKLVDTKTGKVRDHKFILPSELSKKTGYDLDNKVHQYLYNFLNNYSHTNFSTLGHFLDMTDAPEFSATSDISESPTVLILSLYLATLLLVELEKFEDLDPPDIKSVCRQVLGATELINYTINKLDLEKDDKLYLLIVERLKIALKESIKESYLNPSSSDKKRINRISPDIIPAS
ncbi:hypothetical protein J6I44_02970 [Aliifodinibius sp. 1BSP15-2V2]|uniref:Uncharacterized protein n=1 Tax=Fodinibius salsisoli TaxID=2820877 RepID=A0ABT3PIQ3_9BACT|nr:hypothetical protein [Fodinibius salsisoli]